MTPFPTHAGKTDGSTRRTIADATSALAIAALLAGRLRRRDQTDSLDPDAGLVFELRGTHGDASHAVFLERLKPACLLRAVEVGEDAGQFT